MATELITALTAAFISFVTVVGYKLLEHRLGKSARDALTKADERNYLKDELTKLWKRIDALDDDITVWRDKYYKAQDSIATLRAQIDVLTDQLAHLREQLALASITSTTSTTRVTKSATGPTNMGGVESGY